MSCSCSVLFCTVLARIYTYICVQARAIGIQVVGHLIWQRVCCCLHRVEGERKKTIWSLVDLALGFRNLNCGYMFLHTHARTPTHTRATQKKPKKKKRQQQINKHVIKIILINWPIYFILFYCLLKSGGCMHAVNGCLWDRRCSRSIKEKL